MSNEKLPRGYKQTDVGVIPEDWKSSILDSICSKPMQNGVFYKPSLKGSGVRLINVGDLYKQTPISLESLELFNATDDEKERFKVKKGDLFFTRSSIVPSGIAHCNIYLSSHDEAVVFDSHVIRVRPDRELILPSYLFNFCISPIARKYLVAHAKTATMTTIDQGVLGKCPVLIPQPLEQEAIATTLSDTDALIEALEQLIAKKRHIKQGTMQELLTGKRRLPGFGEGKGYKQTEIGVIPEDWKVVTADQICELVVDCKNRTPPVVEGGDFAVVRTPNVRHGKFVQEDLRFTDKYSFVEWTARAVPQIGDILITREAPLGEVCLVPENLQVCLGQRMMLYRPDFKKLDSSFLLYMLMAPAVQNCLQKKIGGSTVGHAKVDDIRNLAVPIPPTKVEQKEIATILSDMDTEIATLEAKLTKTRQLKQGMMHNLLTGRIRLV